MKKKTNDRANTFLFRQCKKKKKALSNYSMTKDYNIQWIPVTYHFNLKVHYVVLRGPISRNKKYIP